MFDFSEVIWILLVTTRSPRSLVFRIFFMQVFRILQNLSSQTQYRCQFSE